ncbi:MAG: DNA recombination protein RmuC [Faecalibacterium sp.]|jgi:DNA recombination protein RmuC|nr:DNA recombination protein RmuC [Faecalibacterium sp.]
MTFEAIVLLLLGVALALLAGILLKLLTAKNKDYTKELEAWMDDRIQHVSESFDHKLSELRTELSANNLNAAKSMSDALQTSVHTMGATMSGSQAQQLRLLEQRLKTLESGSEQKLDAMRSTLNANMEAMRSDNAKKLEDIRQTVDAQLQDALQKRLNESFRTVSAQLEQVYKGLGEMQSLASDVGGLKQVLSGVKTRGILGEIQLGGILEEILAPEQYATNINTIPGSTQRVEYAVKMPGAAGTVWLPIDAKFPGDTYVHLQDAYAGGDAADVESARRALTTVVCSEAKDIREKYVAVPYTTNFGILFLPFEGLYAEVVNLGLLEKLQREYSVNVAGPSTMAALLNSLQMGFKTLAIQKRSGEVWQVLGAVKTEFGKFSEGLTKMQQHLRQTDEDLDRLIGTRTRAINRRLSAVQQLDGEDAADILHLAAEGTPALPENALPDFAQEEETAEDGAEAKI